MKTVKLKILTSINLLLASLIALTGVGCKSQKAKKGKDNKQLEVTEEQSMTNEPIECMYGVPNARYAIKGEVLNADGKALRGMRVIAHLAPDDAREIAVAETAKDGSFELSYSGFPVDKLYITVLGEPAVTVMQEINLQGGDGKWDLGEGNLSGIIITVPTHNTNQPPVVKYGVPVER